MNKYVKTYRASQPESRPSTGVDLKQYGRSVFRKGRDPFVALVLFLTLGLFLAAVFVWVADVNLRACAV